MPRKPRQSASGLPDRNHRPWQNLLIVRSWLVNMVGIIGTQEGRRRASQQPSLEKVALSCCAGPGFSYAVGALSVVSASYIEVAAHWGL
jgi:hypothetical protein